MSKGTPKGYKLADGSYSGEYKVGDKFVVVGDHHYSGQVFDLYENDGSNRPYFTKEKKVVSWIYLKAYKPQFTKSSLKDGMVVTYRNGWQRFVLGDKLLGVNDGNVGKYLSDYDDGLLNTKPSGKDLDIVKVSYMSEVLWQREEPLTPKQLKQQRITKELEFAEAKRERLNAHIERLKRNLED